MSKPGFSKKEFKSILPPNSTALEKAVEKSCFRATNLEGALSYLWNPGDKSSMASSLLEPEINVDHCPISFLPYLAWGLNIEIWNSEWSEYDKRNIIKKYLYIRKIRGTLKALVEAFKALGVHIKIKEWWQEGLINEENRRPFYFELNLYTRENSTISEENRQAIHWMADKLKPLRSKYDLYFVYYSEAHFSLNFVGKVTKIARFKGELLGA